MDIKFNKDSFSRKIVLGNIKDIFNHTISRLIHFFNLKIYIGLLYHIYLYPIFIKMSAEIYYVYLNVFI